MSDELEYNFQKVNEGEVIGRYGFMLGGKCVRLDQTREPTEPMRTRRAVRLSHPLDREPNQNPPVQKDKDLLDIDLSQLKAWLSGEPDPVPVEPEPELDPYHSVPLPVIELDRRPDFVDLIRAEHHKTDVVQRPETNSFVGFLHRHYADERDRLKRMMDAVLDDI